LKNRYIYNVIIVVVVIAWEYFGQASNTVRLLLSSPSHVVHYFSEEYASLLAATATTLLESVLGLLIATSFSFGIMIICFYKPKFLNFIMPVMIGSQVVPLIVLAPFFIILLGIGLSSKVAMAALISFFPVFVNFGTGVKAIPKEITEFAHINKTSTWRKIKNIYFPLSLPSIFAGLKIAATLAVIGAIVAEFTGAKIGLGKNLFLSAKRLEPELMMTSLLLSTFLGALMFGLILIIEKRNIKWIGKKK
jgi:NitT/TauT family transport system permease protein